MGNEVATLLRLGPYSPMLNPIENIWSKIKTYVKTHLRVPQVRGIGIVEQKLLYLEEIMDSAKETIVGGDYARAVQHTTIFHAACLLLQNMQVGRNVFVITAIFIDRNLQNVANYLIVSLAVADLMVACLVMPLGAVYVISNNWMMGPEVCDIFWAVTNVDYMHTRNRRRIVIMIAVVWVIALIVSLSPQIPQFKDPDYLYRIEVKKQCLVSQDVKYQVFATFSTFYLPLLIIFILYWKIFQTARKRIRKRRDLKSGDSHVDASTVRSSNSSKSSDSFVARRYIKIKCSKKPSAEVLTTSLLLVEGQSIVGTEEVDGTHGSDVASEEETTTFTTNKREPDVDSTTQSCNASPKRLLPTQSNGSVSRHSTAHKETPTHIVRKEKKESIEAKRERKAAKTLAIITGAFVMCWLPFFILALLLPLCGDACNISGYVMSFALWLGYFNSTLNPVIYTVFSPEFRQAFKRILFGPQRQRGSYRSGRLK
nr:unnamed protein product [Callosobruchus analis]